MVEEVTPSDDAQLDSVARELVIITIDQVCFDIVNYSVGKKPIVRTELHKLAAYIRNRYIKLEDDNENLHSKRPEHGEGRESLS